MTTTEDQRSPATSGSAASAAPRSRSAERAYLRREKREQRLTHDRLSRTGRPVRSALARVPFVVALIVVLGGGISGVLYLNTKTDESGIRTEDAQQKIADLNLQIEALNRSIADLDATPRIAQQAQALGMVPAGDAAILQVPASGAPTVIGTPSVVPTPASARAVVVTAGPPTVAATTAAPTDPKPAPTASTKADAPATAPKSAPTKTTVAATTAGTTAATKSAPTKTTVVATTAVTTAATTAATQAASTQASNTHAVTTHAPAPTTARGSATASGAAKPGTTVTTGGHG